MKQRYRFTIMGLIAATILSLLVAGLLWKGPKLYTVTVLSSLGGWSHLSHAMNDLGQVVGVEHVGKDQRLFLWDRATGMKELAAPEPGPCWPASINGAGQVLMISDPMGSSRWFLLDPNGPILLNEVPLRTSLRNVNRNSCMAGIDKSNSSEPYLVFWDDKRISKRLFPVCVHGQMTKLNDKNQVACTSFRSRRWERWRTRLFGPRMMADESISYLWDPARGKIPLDRYVPDAERFPVVDLNNNGCLIGSVYTKDRHWHAVLLEPIPKRRGR